MTAQGLLVVSAPTGNICSRISAAALYVIRAERWPEADPAPVSSGRVVARRSVVKPLPRHRRPRPAALSGLRTKLVAEREAQIVVFLAEGVYSNLKNFTAAWLAVCYGRAGGGRDCWCAAEQQDGGWDGYDDEIVRDFPAALSAAVATMQEAVQTYRGVLSRDLPIAELERVEAELDEARKTLSDWEGNMRGLRDSSQTGIDQGRGARLAGRTRRDFL